MRHSHFALILAACVLAQPAFADKDMDSDSKPCATIAQACRDAGFAKTESDGKKFWKDCMKPVILGQTVEGVKAIDANIIKMCRADKIANLKKQLKEFQNAFSGNGNSSEGNNKE
jgi:hypothetical protein